MGAQSTIFSLPHCGEVRKWALTMGPALVLGQMLGPPSLCLKNCPPVLISRNAIVGKRKASAGGLGCWALFLECVPMCAAGQALVSSDLLFSPL